MEELIEVLAEIVCELFAFKWFQVLFTIFVLGLASYGIYYWVSYDPYDGIETFTTEQL